MENTMSSPHEHPGRIVSRTSDLTTAGSLRRAACSAALALLACGSEAVDTKLFVERQGDRAVLDGREFRFVGSNNYYQMYVSTVMVDDVLGTAARAGFNTLRVWGALDIGTPGGDDSIAGPARDVYFQYWDGSAPAQNEGPNGLERLDYVVAKAGELGVRLVIPFVNNWNDFGGMNQYVRWREMSTPDSDAWFHDDFYTDPVIRGWYKAWISYLLNRKNTLTGVAYKDDPTVAIWELGNEPRCTGTGGSYPRSESCTTDTLLGWADEMSAFIKSIDHHHLVSVGDEGFYCLEDGTHWTEQCGDGVDTRAFAALPNIDVMSWHLYPEAWGTDAAWGTEWIRRHVDDARALGKIGLLGEFGLTDTKVRNRVYREWLEVVENGTGNGALYWILSGLEDDGTRYGDFDGFTLYEDSPAFQTMVNFAQAHGGGMANDFPPVADHDSVYLTHDTSEVFDLRTNDVGYGAASDRLHIDLDASAAGQQTALEVNGNAFEVDADDNVRVTPAPGFIGRLDLPYRAVDGVGRESNAATLSIVVSPDPLLVSSFEAGVEGWGPLNAQTGTVMQSGAFATHGSYGLEVTGSANNNWYGVTLDSPLDLSERRAIAYDISVGPGDGTNRGARIFYGAVRCQSRPTRVPQNTVEKLAIDLRSMNCTGGEPDFTQATSLYLRFSPGTFHIDNVQIE
jgi:mannan endo-1,4-beta-mannosidase